jgi:hypothetical protein
MKKGVLAAIVVSLAVPVGAAGPRPEPGLSPQEAQDAFARIKALAGRWRGGSTKGWHDEVRIRTIAGGSAVVEDGGGTLADAAGPHPGDEMMTVFYLDGDRLMLTHYCGARNHPRLLATSAADGGRTLTFRFVDGANIPSRETGHMDSVVLRLPGADRFTSRWTWYGDGIEKWDEEIERTRVVGASR